ncbi:GH1 family beta-glucosidase [Sphingomonas melonis]|uniref:Beta-glucosidase n=1 Tax=Sphingomonas melonis TaxID=152682 RepID=A0A7Y9FKY9_9SPHN|nr:beta-glucosidase [Sphingomonas melonis]
MITRRKLVGAAGAGAALGLAGPVLSAPTRFDFPKAFRWGCSTAAYQIEGAAREDGRGESIWDVYARTPGKVKNGDTGDVSCDGYHRYREDAQLIRDLGAGAYRLSIAWPRIFPEGKGTINQKGLDHYSRVIDDLLEKGIEPHVTLFHWDLPTALRNGWRARDTAMAFADYAAVVARTYSDRVGHFMTVNEIQSFIDNGYGAGTHAPGMQLGTAELNQARHHALLAHGLGVRAIRANARRPVQVGWAENVVTPVPVVETPEHVVAAQKALRRLNATITGAILTGRYAADMNMPPVVAAGDMAIISSPIDFVALNVYSPIYVRSAPEVAEGYAIVPRPLGFPTMGLDWLTVGPEAAYWAARHVSEVWKPRSLFISENGCPGADTLVDGRVEDTDRIMFLRAYLSNVQRAVAEGYPLHGYFVWSLLDNFEWSEGYTKRFGIHYVDYATQRRIPKRSAQWYRELIRRGTLV